VLDPSWAEIWRRIRRLSPYLWPSRSTYLQLLAVSLSYKFHCAYPDPLQSLCIIILLFGRVINLAIPLTLGELIRVFDGRSDRSPWPLLFGYVALRFLQGSGGLAAIRDVINLSWSTLLDFLTYFLVPVGSCDAIL
jgi:ATP-binding cassette subfamily B (MDR/TAP) protein 6